MAGFDKIEFTEKKKEEKSSLADHKESSFTMSKERKSGKKIKLRFGRKSIIAFIVILLLLGLAAIPGFATYKSAIKTYRDVKLVSAALKTEDIALASDQIAKTKTDLKDTQKNFHYLLPFKFIPLISFYYNDADHLMQAGAYG